MSSGVSYSQTVTATDPAPSAVVPVYGMVLKLLSPLERMGEALKEIYGSPLFSDAIKAKIAEWQKAFATKHQALETDQQKKSATLKIAYLIRNFINPLIREQIKNEANRNALAALVKQFRDIIKSLLPPNANQDADVDALLKTNGDNAKVLKVYLAARATILNARERTLTKIDEKGDAITDNCAAQHESLTKEEVDARARCTDRLEQLNGRITTLVQSVAGVVQLSEKAARNTAKTGDVIASVNSVD